MLLKARVSGLWVRDFRARGLRVRGKGFVGGDFELDFVGGCGWVLVGVGGCWWVLVGVGGCGGV